MAINGNVGRRRGERAWHNIGGAIDASYTLAQADVGNWVRVVVDVTYPDGDEWEVMSAALAVVAADTVETLVSDPLVSVTGEARWGEVLALEIEAKLGDYGYRYQWQRRAAGERTWRDIGGATDASYTLVRADVGNWVRVVVDVTYPDGDEWDVASAATDLVADVSLVRVTGVARQRGTLRADTGRVADLDGAPAGGVDFRYQWQRSAAHGGWTDIAGATGSSYRLRQADVGHALRVVVSFTDAEGDEQREVMSAATAVVRDVNDAATGPVRVRGVARQYATLRADPGAVADMDGVPAGGFDFRYQWQRSAAHGGWTAIAGATGQRYELTQADVGQRVRVVVRFSDALGGRERLRSAQTGVVANVNDAATGPVRVTGVARQYETLRADTGAVADIDGLPADSAAYRYQWQRSAAGAEWADIAGATGSGYQLAQADVGQALRVVVRFTDALGGREVLYSRATGPVANVNDAATGPVRVTGVARQYETLRADTGAVADMDGLPADGFGYRYQWQRGVSATDDTGTETVTWGDIGGATGTGYTLAQADVGQALRVVVRFTDALGGREVLYSRATGPVANVNDAATGPVRVTGVARQYETLRADPGAVADMDGLPAGGFGYRYQWQRGVSATDDTGTETTTWGDIDGATGTDYTLAQADVGQTVRVVVRFTDALGGREVLYSRATGPVANVNDAATGPVRVTGVVRQYETLRADTGAVADIDGLPADSAAYRYQWQRSAAGAEWADIAGATGSGYQLAQADVGQALRVVVRFSDALGGREVLYSRATGPVANVNDAATGPVRVTGVARQYTLRADTGAGYISWRRRTWGRRCGWWCGGAIYRCAGGSGGIVQPGDRAGGERERCGDGAGAGNGCGASVRDLAGGPGRGGGYRRGTGGRVWLPLSMAARGDHDG